MHRRILQIAVPSIVSNITVPLLALVDTTIVGHLGAAAYIGAIALGGMLFNMAYWLFGFLRMGTGGLTAQAYGANRPDEAQRILARSLSVGLALAAALIVLQRPLVNLAFGFITATPEVERLARTYYAILIWGAPAVLGLYSFTGWFLGMQNARLPMLIALLQNVVNIAVSLGLVMGLGWKVEGVATGTLVAQYAGLLMALCLWHRRFGGKHPLRGDAKLIFNRKDFGRFFSLNRDIFLRTLCLIAVSTYFTSAGSARGELALAANTLLMQFFILFSYVMDGFAYAGEALGGRYFGARDARSFKRLTHSLFLWGGALAGGFTLVYWAGGSTLLGLLTGQPEVVSAATHYLPFAIALPAVSFSAFLFDGLYIGTTSTRPMLCSMAAAAGAFFAFVFLLPGSNTALWASFLIYLGTRGTAQALLYPKVAGKFFNNSK